MLVSGVRVGPGEPAHYDRIDAERDCERIRDFWIRQGYPGIRAEPVYIPGHHVRGEYHTPTYGIRSNIGPDGFPPRY